MAHTVKNLPAVQETWVWSLGREDPLEKKEIKNRWQEYTEELYKKGFNDPDNHDGVTHLEPDILECDIKWALGTITSNKASGGDGIPAELFRTLKAGAVKVLHSVCQQIWKTQQSPQDCKSLVFISIPKKGNARVFKLLHNCTYFTCQRGNAQNPSS